MIAWFAIVAVALIPIAVVALVLALFAGVAGSIAERDLGVGLWADRAA
jgi:hypothetical protein